MMLFVTLMIWMKVPVQPMPFPADDRNDEQEKAEGHAEALRKRNEELEEQIKQWAIEAVGKTVADAAPSEKAA